MAAASYWFHGMKNGFFLELNTWFLRYPIPMPEVVAVRAKIVRREATPLSVVNIIIVDD